MAKINEVDLIEKNKMQFKFSNDDFCLKFLLHVFPQYMKDKNERSYEFYERKNKVYVELTRYTGEKYIYQKTIAGTNIDVSYKLGLVYDEIKQAWFDSSNKKYPNYDELDTTYYTEEIRIMIVPNVDDNYPKILEKMHKYNLNCLYAKKYVGKSISKQELVNLFKDQGIIIEFEKEVNTFLK
ncbi:MAG: hypothetical protein NTZ33_14660 [Bacteroidetes bacterium]|nr:hypothetical protein [Bacteroidota bacterium]